MLEELSLHSKLWDGQILNNFIGERITNFTFWPTYIWRLELDRSTVNSTHMWFIHFIPSLFCFIYVELTEFYSLLWLFLASINGKWKCQVRTWNKECFKTTSRINLKNQGDQVGNHQSKQKTGAMVSRWGKNLCLSLSNTCIRKHCEQCMACTVTVRQDSRSSWDVVFIPSCTFLDGPIPPGGYG